MSRTMCHTITQTQSPPAHPSDDAAKPTQTTSLYLRSLFLAIFQAAIVFYYTVSIHNSLLEAEMFQLVATPESGVGAVGTLVGVGLWTAMIGELSALVCLVSQFGGVSALVVEGMGRSQESAMGGVSAVGRGGDG